jgi:hypothetical protein
MVQSTCVPESCDPQPVKNPEVKGWELFEYEGVLEVLEWGLREASTGPKAVLSVCQLVDIGSG